MAIGTLLFDHHAEVHELAVLWVHPTTGSTAGAESLLVGVPANRIRTFRAHDSDSGLEATAQQVLERCLCVAEDVGVAGIGRRLEQGRLDEVKDLLGVGSIRSERFGNDCCERAHLAIVSLDVGNVGAVQQSDLGRSDNRSALALWG